MPKMRFFFRASFRDFVIALALLASAISAHAHGIAGNRYFVGTLTFDDPAVADEAILPNFSTRNHPVEGCRLLSSVSTAREGNIQPQR